MKFQRLFLGLALAWAAFSNPVAEGKGSFQIHAGAGLSAFLVGHGITFNGSFIYKPNNSNFHFGVDSGVYLMRFDPSIVMIPILPTFYYVIPVSGKVKPYIGSALGLMINASNNPTADALAIYLRPGLQIPLSNGMDVNLETRVGAVDGVLHIVGQTTFAFKI